MRACLRSIMALILFLGSVPTIGWAADVTSPPTAPIRTLTALPVVKALSVAMPPLQGTTPSNPTGGQEVGGWVQLSGPAPCVYHCGQTLTGQQVGGMLVLLSSSNPVVAKAPASILVPVGKTVQAFTLITSPVAAPTPVVISAWREGSPPQTATATVVPPSLTRIAVDQASVTSGTVVHGTAFFTGPPASAGTVVAKLSSNNSAAVQFQPSVTLDVNKTVAPFDIQTLGVANNTPVVISGSYGGAPKNVALTVLRATFKDFGVTQVQGGQQLYFHNYDCNSPCAVYLGGILTGWAPPGAEVHLSGNNQAVLPVPDHLPIPAASDKFFTNPTAAAVTSNTPVEVSATYLGVTKKMSVLVKPLIKPDLVIKRVTLQDRYDNAITRPQDSQPFKMCVTVWITPDYDQFSPTWPTIPTPPSALRVSYSGPTGIGTSAGKEYDININFTVTAGYDALNNRYVQTPCTELPGLQPGGYYDVTLTADFYNKVDERNEGNNTYKLRISR